MTFDEMFYLQIQGTAVRTIFAPSKNYQWVFHEIFKIKLIKPTKLLDALNSIIPAI